MYFQIQLMRTTRVFDDSAQGLAAQNGREVPGAAHGRYALLLVMCQMFASVANAPVSGMIAS
ncbi:hypothetical protein EMIT0P253_100151 [Pseudomonas sp. IT-P253]|jgi:hypothetical protein